MNWQGSARRVAKIVGLLTAAIVVGAVYFDAQHASPGKLASVHERHIRLADSQNCAACHGEQGQSMASACMKCHADIGAQLSQSRGLHGQMSGDEAANCATCHSEHHGERFQITNQRSFALAGVSKVEEFDHAGLDFSLQGKHSEAACATCHPNADAPVLAPGEKRFLGLDQNCASCHRDVHKGSYGQNCESCHGQEHPFPRVAKFQHTSAFELVGLHGKAACDRCHAKNSPDAVGALLAARKPDGENPRAARTCRECHASPHGGQFLMDVADSLQLDPDASCSHCHAAAHASFLAPLAQLDPRLHACSGFALGPPHDKAACTACHAGLGKPKDLPGAFDRSFPGRQPDDCRACHGDPHRGQFDKGTFPLADCLTCHQRHRFVPATFGKKQHARTQFPLRGAHAKTACIGCHPYPGPESRPVDGAGSRGAASFLADSGPAVIGEAESPDGDKPARIFHGAPTACNSCHRDPHRGQFDNGAFRGADCRACHDEQSFRVSTFTIAAHRKTGFPLTGAHRAVGCNACHRPAGEVLRRPMGDLGSRENHEAHSAGVNEQPSPAAPNALRVFRGTPAKCGECHVDVHHGQFDRSDLPAERDGKTDCARCHSTSAFDDIEAESFDHSLWTNYELRGAHAKTKCAACHAPHADLLHDRDFGPAAGRRCQSCHSDPHVGQFGPTERVSCTKCHVDGMSFRELAFDHGIDSIFKLDRDHRDLNCAACHKPQRLPGGGTAVRYKPLGDKCGDCHVPRGPRPKRTRAQR